jgi:hypothetical protein
MWQPDGSSFASSFGGMDPNGAWTLFIADLSTVGVGRLEDWSLTLTAVPEPSTFIAGAVLLLPLLVQGARSLRKRKQPGAAVLISVLLLVFFDPFSVRGALVVNGDFEEPVVTDPAGYQTYVAGSSFSGWSVGIGGVYDPPHEGIDLCRNWGGIQAPSGSQFVDLNGWDSGRIFQTITTEVGGTYNLSFLIAGNVFSTGDPVLAMHAEWGGLNLGRLTFDITGQTPSGMAWRRVTYSDLRADGPILLSFVSDNTSNGGVLIDNVVVEQIGVIPEPSTFITGALLLLPFVLQGTRHLRKRT